MLNGSDRLSRISRFRGGFKICGYTANVFRRFIISKELKLLYVAVPKSACSTVKFGIAKAKGLDTNRIADIHELETWPANSLFLLNENTELTQFESILNNYYTFTVVRHPELRLVSAYKDKIVGCLEKSNRYRYYNQVASRISGYSQIALDGSEKLEQVPTFSEFVLAVSKTPRQEWDLHWAEQWMLTAGPLINYNKVCRVESLVEDLREVALDLGLDADVFEERRNSTAKVGKIEVSASDRELIEQLYAEDYRRFGYRSLSLADRP